MARCPCHDDRTPSLSVREIDGRPACHCFGCGAGTRDVHAVLGLPWDGPAEPLADFARALAFGRRQNGHRHREVYSAADAARPLLKEADELRRDATILGDCDEAWEFADTAAALELQARNLTA